MDYILSEKNKEFLWNILYEKKIFNGIPDNNLDKVKNLFENIIGNVSQNTKNNEILEINKEILKKLNVEIINFKKNLLESKNIKEQFKDEKILVFDKNLEIHKNSLNKLINPNKPKEINFKDNTDNTDKPIDNNEMNKILELMQKERNIEIKNTELENTNTEIKKTITEDKISDKNLIKLDNNMNNPVSENLPKIKSIDNLLEKNINEDKIINETINTLEKKNFKLKDFNSILEEEYIKENRINSSIKLDSIHKLLIIILENQKKIMNKLEL
tara:strand:- start:3494 stop:4309 length:816 start_codon:yes stop_codon:yes gene_type:complete